MADIEDFVSPEVGVAVAVTSVALHPTVRKTLRRGLVLVLGASLAIWEKVTAFASGVAPVHLPGGASEPLHDEGQDLHEEAHKGRSPRKSGAPS